MRNLLASTEDKIFFKDRQGRFLLVSDSFLSVQAHGRSLDELLGKTDFDLFSRPHAAAALEDEQRVIETGEPIIAKVEQKLHDPVTGLANRAELMDRLAQTLVALERQPGRVALLFADLDAFKEINDSLGHDSGDQVLVEVGRRLTQVARRVDTVARLGSDEFVLLCPELGETDNAMYGAKRAGGDRLRIFGPDAQPGHVS